MGITGRFAAHERDRRVEESMSEFASATAPHAESSTGAVDRNAQDESLIRSVAWTGAAKWVSQLVAWLSTLVVARLLSPDDYGIIGMATVFLGVVMLFSDFGLGVAVVTLRDLDDHQIAQLNTVAVVLGVVGFVVCCAAAKPVEAFFHSNRVGVVIVVFALTFVISGFRIIPNALLERELRFRSLAIFDTINGVTVAVASVLFAWAGFHYWTLVIAGVLGQIILTLLTIAARRHPFARPSWTSLRESLDFTRYQLGSSLLWYGYSNSDFVVAGRMLGQAELGIYSLAWTIATTLPEKILGLITRVTPAYFAEMQHDTEGLRRYLLRMTEILSIGIVPALLGVAMVAGDFVHIALGDRWSGVVWPLRFLCVYGALNSTTVLLARVLTVRGEWKYLFRIHVVSFIVLPVSFAIGSRWGGAGIAAAWLLVFPPLRLHVVRRTARCLGISSVDYLKAYWPAMSSSLVMMAAASLIGILFPWHEVRWARLVLEVIGGAAAYVATLVYWHRGRVQVVLTLLGRLRTMAIARRLSAA